jgi:fluoroacetyl-CoA thioesterase
MPCGLCWLVELVGVSGRKLRFKVACWDEDGLIGEGFHERAVIERSRFMARVEQKAAIGRRCERAPAS